jgi:hypothetical protein
MTRRFGLEWVMRDDGCGFEVKGIAGEMMRLFSSHQESISAGLRPRRAVRAAVRPRVFPARASATCASVELTRRKNTEGAFHSA